MSDERPVKRADLEMTQVEDGFVAYDEVNSRVHHLNASLVAVFDLATGARTAADIAAAVAFEYELDEPPLVDVESAIEQLRREGLVG
jgi:hypothetical protein